MSTSRTRLALAASLLVRRRITAEQVLLGDPRQRPAIRAVIGPEGCLHRLERRRRQSARTAMELPWYARSPLGLVLALLAAMKSGWRSAPDPGRCGATLLASMERRTVAPAEGAVTLPAEDGCRALSPDHVPPGQDAVVGRPGCRPRSSVPAPAFLVDVADAGQRLGPGLAAQVVPCATNTP
ncbi:MAG: hypothetical protein U1E53_04765 [Dongiaceae bacterium]